MRKKEASAHGADPRNDVHIEPVATQTKTNTWFSADARPGAAVSMFLLVSSVVAVQSVLGQLPRVTVLHPELTGRPKASPLPARQPTQGPLAAH